MELIKTTSPKRLYRVLEQFTFSNTTFFKGEVRMLPAYTVSVLRKKGFKCEPFTWQPKEIRDTAIIKWQFYRVPVGSSFKINDYCSVTRSERKALASQGYLLRFVGPTYTTADKVSYEPLAKSREMAVQCGLPLALSGDVPQLVSTPDDVSDFLDEETEDYCLDF